MPTTTTNYGFTKPSGGEAVNIATLNADLDSIDTRLKTNADAGGLAALKANNLSDLPSPSTARTNLGLGSGATSVFTGVTQPHPPTGTEYVWFQTDGAGTLLDILSGVA